MFAILESLAWIGLLFFALRVIQLAYLPPFPSPSQLSVRLCRRVSSTTFLRKSSTRLSALFSGAGTVLSWVSFVFNTCRRAFYSLCSCLSSLYSFSSTVFSTSTNLRNPSHLTFNNILQVIFSNPRLTLEHAHTQGYTVQPASTFATSSSSPRQPKKKSAESFFRARMTADPDPLHQQLNEAKPGLDCAASTREGGRVWKGGYNLDMPKRAELEGGSVSMMTGIALARMYRVADEELRKRDLSMPPFFQEDRPFCFLPEEIGGFWVAYLPFPATRPLPSAGDFLFSLRTLQCKGFSIDIECTTEGTTSSGTSIEEYFHLTAPPTPFDRIKKHLFNLEPAKQVAIVALWYRPEEEKRTILAG